LIRFNCPDYSDLCINNYLSYIFHSNGASNSQTPDSNPFEEEEWDEEEGVGPDGALVDNGEPGVPVKALYDYEGAEADELSFKQGKNK